MTIFDWFLVIALVASLFGLYSERRWSRKLDSADLQDEDEELLAMVAADVWNRKHDGPVKYDFDWTDKDNPSVTITEIEDDKE